MTKSCPVIKNRMINGVIAIIVFLVSCDLGSFAQEARETSLKTTVAEPKPTHRQGRIIAFTTAFTSPGNSPRNMSVMGIDERYATVGSDAQTRAALTHPLAIFLVYAEKHNR